MMNRFYSITKREVVLNKLIRIDVDSQENTRSWQSYSPPPWPLPLSYQNKRKMNTLSYGLNWSPIQEIQVNINYRYRTQDRFNEIGSNHGLVSPLVCVLE